MTSPIWEPAAGETLALYREATRFALRDGAVDFVGGSAHSALAAFPEWQGVKLLCAQAQGMYWFLVVRADLKATRGDLSVLERYQRWRRFDNVSMALEIASAVIVITASMVRGSTSSW